MATQSREPIAGAAAPAAAETQCVSCGAPLAPNQRYCLECGERRATVSDFLRSGPPAAAASPPPTSPPSRPPSAGGPARSNNTLSLLAGVGVLLLAMGVGVLIGRSGGSSAKTPPAAIVTVPSGTGSSSAAAEESFSGDWPSGTKGYTVELQTLPTSGTTVASVNQAKTAATAKGASSVGALKSEEFSSLPSGSYVIYSGVYHKRAEAEKALGPLEKKFPGAKVIEVSEGGSGGSKASKEPESSSSGSSPSSGESKKAPAPSSVLEGLQHAKGKSYVEKAKALPNKVET